MNIVLVNAIPIPRGISGIIYELDGSTQVVRGTYISINDTTSGQFISGKSGYGSSGRYSVSLNGNNGDVVIIKAWNRANAANRTVILNGVMYSVDILLNMTLPNYPPNINSLPVTSVNEDILYQYAVKALDDNVEDVLQYYLIDAPLGMSIDSNGLITWLPENDDVGEHNITIIVSDYKYNTMQSFILSVQNVNDAPEIISGALTSAIEDIEYVYDVEAVDIDGDVLLYSLLSKPLGMEINQTTGLIKWIPANDNVGFHNITIGVSDYNVTIYQSFIIQVENINDAPNIISSPNTTAIEDLEYTYDVNAVDDDKDALNYSLIAAPDGMSINHLTGLIEWTPINDQVGYNNVTVKVSDGEFSKNQSFAIYVINVNDAPTVINPVLLNATINVLFTYNLNASDPDGDKLTYSIITSITPSKKLEIDNNGTINWIPRNNEIGNNTAAVMISDGIVSTNISFVINVIKSKSDAPNKNDDESQKDEASKGNSGGSGGGGGSSGSGGGISKSLTVTEKRYDSENRRFSFKINGLQVNEIIVKPKDNTGDVNIHVEEFLTKPNDLPTVIPKKVYLYIKIKEYNDTNFEETIIRFKVDKKWLEKNKVKSEDVILNRFVNNTWVELPTNVSSADNENFYYDSISKGFSYFAISLKDMKYPDEIVINSIPNPFKILGTLYVAQNKQAPEGVPFIVENLNTQEVVIGSSGMGEITGSFLAVINGDYGQNVSVIVNNSKPLIFQLREDITELKFVYNKLTGKYVPISKDITFKLRDYVYYSILIISILIICLIIADNKIKRIAMIAIYLIFMFNIVKYVTAPPLPHNVDGFVFHSDGTTGVDNGIPVKINDTVSGDVVLTYTDAPDVPALKGFYSATIDGSDGDMTIATAWNSTHYGNASGILSSTTTIDVILNTIRPSEPNVTIVSPLNNSLFNIPTQFNVTANITIIGGQNGIGCNATINFSDNGVLNLTDGETYTHGIGDINLGSYNFTFWTITPNRNGTTNITVRAKCSSDGQNFYNLNSYTSYNITIEDRIAPNIKLEYPANGSIFTVSIDSINITFRYNVSDYSAIANCSLVINDKINLTNYTVEKDVSQNFTQSLSIGNYIWNVQCTDNSTSYNTGSSQIFNLTIISNVAPVVSNVKIDNPIDLNSGSTITVSCNATVRDENNASDITAVNATFFSSVSFSSDSDDNNHHYTNGSCSVIDSSAYQRNYTCSFNLQYYANNGTWRCNVFATDFLNETGSGNVSNVVNELLSIDVSPLLIKYANLEPTNISDDANITITNFGNRAFNVTVDGYGSVDGDGLAMNCEIGNISISSERYSIINNSNFDTMRNLTDSPIQIANLTLFQRINDADFGTDRNMTFWKLQVSTATKGDCNGTIIFKAVGT